MHKQHLYNHLYLLVGLKNRSKVQAELEDAQTLLVESCPTELLLVSIEDSCIEIASSTFLSFIAFRIVAHVWPYSCGYSPGLHPWITHLILKQHFWCCWSLNNPPWDNLELGRRLMGTSWRYKRSWGYGVYDWLVKGARFYLPLAAMALAGLIIYMVPDSAN